MEQLTKLLAQLNNDPHSLDLVLFQRAPEFLPKAEVLSDFADRPLSFIVGQSPSRTSASVFMWDVEFALRGIPDLFLPADIDPGQPEALTEFLEAAVNVRKQLRVLTFTDPFKIRALEFFQGLAKRWPELVSFDPSAVEIGATNQVLVGPDSKLLVMNSDGIGMVRSIQSHLSNKGLASLPGTKVVMIGAGGSAQAIAYELAKTLGPRGQLYIANRTPEKAFALADKLNQALQVQIVHGMGLDGLKDGAVFSGAHVLLSVITEGDPLHDMGLYALVPKATVLVDVNHGAKSHLLEHATAAHRTDLYVFDGSGMVVEGYLVPSMRLADLWHYEVPKAVYRQIAGYFKYQPFGS